MRTALFASVALISLVTTASATSRAATPVTDSENVAVAEQAFERARLGAQWLAGNVRPDGSYNYIYDPTKDSYSASSYSIARHASATYSLYQSYDVFRDESMLEAADHAVRFIAEHAQPVEGRGRAFLYRGRATLGGQAIPIVALTERRRITGDTSYDDLIRDLATFMLSLEMPDQPGRFVHAYDVSGGAPVADAESPYYPGESFLALTRLARNFPDESYLEPAMRTADYLIYRRHGDLPALGNVRLEDHWTTIGMGELYRLRPEPAYRTVAFLEGNSIVSNQYSPEDGRPDLVGASRLQNPASYVSSAARGEALVSAWDLAAFVGDSEAAERFGLGARRDVEFLMRGQYTDEKTAQFPRPDRLIGAWPHSVNDPTVRIDFVRHSVSALVGVWHLTTQGGLPIPSPGQ